MCLMWDYEGALYLVILILIYRYAQGMLNWLFPVKFDQIIMSNLNISSVTITGIQQEENEQCAWASCCIDRQLPSPTIKLLCDVP